MIVTAGLSVTDYFKQKMQEKSNKVSAADKKEERNHEYRASFAQAHDEVDSIEAEATPSKKKKKRKLTSPEEEMVVPEEETAATEEPIKKKKKKSKKEPEVIEIQDETVDAEVEVPKKSKKSKKRTEPEAPVEVSPPGNDKKSKKQKNKVEETPVVISTEPESSTVNAKTSKKSKKAGEPQRPMGANAVYSTNVVQIPSHVAQKLSCVEVNKYKNSNIGAIVGYGLTEDIEIKVVQTKVGDHSINTDKYSLYNTDKIMTRQRVNPRKILSKLKRTKKSIQVI